MGPAAIIGGAVSALGDITAGVLNFIGVKKSIQGQKELQQNQFEQERYLLWFSLANENREIKNNLFERDNTLTYLLIAVVVVIAIIVIFRALKG